ncbi:unnamed protein product [Coccothraustes coccothraustes]
MHSPQCCLNAPLALPFRSANPWRRAVPAYAPPVLSLPLCHAAVLPPPLRCSPGPTLPIPASTPPPREAFPGPLLPQPRTPHPAVSGWARCRNNEDQRVFVTMHLGMTPPSPPVPSPQVFPAAGPRHVRSCPGHVGRGGHAPSPRPPSSLQGD